MNRWELVIFDWDGTLADSISGIVAAMQQAADATGLPKPGEPAVREIIGLGMHDAIQSIWPGLSGADTERLRRAYADAYIGVTQEIHLFPGAATLLARLSEAGVPLAIATGKSRRGLDRALDLTGTANHFAVTRCADEGAGKPDPAMVQHLLDQTGANPGKSVLVGDTAHDLEMARRAGTHAVGVAWGAHDAARLLAYNPLLVAGDMDALHEPLLNPGLPRNTVDRT